MSQENQNPYESPQTESTKVEPNKPFGPVSILMLFFLSVMSLIGGTIVFFVVCAGSGFAGMGNLDATGNGSMEEMQTLFFVAVFLGAAAGIATINGLGRWIYRNRVR